EHNDLVVGHVHAKGLGHAAAVLQSANSTSGTGVQQVTRTPHGQQGKGPDQVVNIPTGGQGNTEELQRSNTGNTIVLTQEFQVTEQVVQGQAPRQGTQGQEVTGQAQCDRAQN